MTASPEPITTAGHLHDEAVRRREQGQSRQAVPLGRRALRLLKTESTKRSREGPSRKAGKRLVSGQFGCQFWPQNASHWPRSLRNRARRWQRASAPSSPQRMPAPLRRRFTTVLQADSTGPLPICQPLDRYSG